jgi:gamma-glutamylcyclotransferase (GGCT)/AIG2-like uncharacterized protein YtfP
VTLLFVYGTLMPGHVRWPILEADATAWRSATTPGRLYDLGQGWPVAHFGPTADRSVVPGVAVDLHPDRATACLAALDRVEGVHDGLFVRVEVDLDDGRRAWAYSWPTPLDDGARIDRWTGPER